MGWYCCALHPTWTWENSLIFLFSSTLMHLTTSWNINQPRLEWKSIEPWNIALDTKISVKKDRAAASFSMFWRIVLTLQSAIVLFSFCKQIWIWILYDIFNARWCIPKTILLKAASLSSTSCYLWLLLCGKQNTKHK